MRRDRPAPPVRLVHVGLGNFFRAHQAWYTDRAPDAEEWGYAALTGRRPDLADALTPQEGLYTVITRAREGDRFDVIGSLSQAHPATDQGAWLAYLRSPDVRAVTLTVTEAGYFRGPDGGLDLDHPAVRIDVEALKGDPDALVHTAPARLVAGLMARRDADAGLHSVTAMPWTEEYQVDLLEMSHRVFDRVEAVVGEQVWNFADFMTGPGVFRVDGNKKGIFTRDRRPKASAHLFRRRWRGVG